MKSNSILDEIRARIAVNLQAKKSHCEYRKIRALAESVDLQKASFKESLKRVDGEIAVIAELKKASPSRGLIREDFDCKILAPSLEKAGASALSVLTEENYFLGSLANLDIVSKIVKIPLLRKDFIFDEYQICEAKIAGASSVLLIAKMLSANDFCSLYKFAHSLNLDVLAEAHDDCEIKMLVDCGADIIGVNCRDLKSFKTDFSVCENLISSIPPSLVRVCESAIEDGAMLKRAKACGADAALIGTSLMSKKCPAQALEQMLEDCKK